MQNIVDRINWDVVRPSLWSAAAGMIVGALALSHLFGFMSPQTADRLVAKKSGDAVIAALAPGCAEDFRELPDAKERLATLAAHKDSFRAEEAFPRELISLPGKSYVDYGLMRACSKLLLKPQTAKL